MLSNTDYTMCIRTERNFCGIQYSPCLGILFMTVSNILWKLISWHHDYDASVLWYLISDDPSSMSFSISGSVMNDVGTAGTDVASSCANDWINIPCATNSLRQDQQSFTSANSEGPNTCVDRICGMVFNSVTQLDINTAIVRPVNSK